MLIEYELLRGRDGPKIGVVRMKDGAITLDVEPEDDRRIVERFFNEVGVLARNEKLADGSVYWAKPGSRTWFQEIVEQRLYYSAGYGYTVLEEAPAQGFLIFRTDHSSGNRRLARDRLDEWTVIFETPSPVADANALRLLLAVREAGFADRGIIEREDDARTIHLLTDRPDLWEIIRAQPPGSTPPGGRWTRLGIDVAYWGDSLFSVLDDVNDAQSDRLNQHGLVDDESDAEAIRRWYVADEEPADDPMLVEIWGAS